MAKDMEEHQMCAVTNHSTISRGSLPYRRLDTTPKEDWTAKWIWDSSDGTEENVWLCFRKTVELGRIRERLTAHIGVDSRYWLYLNGKMAVFEGGVKRGPGKDAGYFDSVEISPYLHTGKNVIAVLVWYWGKKTSYSNTDSGQGGLIFEAVDGEVRICSDNTWKVRRNTAYRKDEGERQPNYRLPESNLYYDARQEIGDWTSLTYDDSDWENAAEKGIGGGKPWGRLFPRGIPLLKHSGLMAYRERESLNARSGEITLHLPYNAQCTPYLHITAPAGKIIRISTENTAIGSVSDTYVTKAGEQEFEALGWFNGERITYEIPEGVTIHSLNYRESGYDTECLGDFHCDDERLNRLWQKSLRTLYVTMRDNFMDCPDRERAQWWGDVTSEMAMTMYSMDTNAYLLYQKGVFTMLNHIDPATKVLQTVVPISHDYFELPVQQLAGICGFWTYYQYTGDREFVRSVYAAARDYLGLWQFGADGLVMHRSGSWDWMDWGERADVTAIENAWYFHALSAAQNMAELLEKHEDAEAFRQKRVRLDTGYQTLWTGAGYCSSGAESPDDRANALAVLSGLAKPERYPAIRSVLTEVQNSSPYMEYVVLEALCRMGRVDLAQKRMRQRYQAMIDEDYSTLWEFWTKEDGTMNHAWSGGPLVVMSKYMAGVRPETAGYETVRISPELGSLRQICCTVPTVRGEIKVKAERRKTGFSLSVSLPETVRAVIALPCAGKTETGGKREVMVGPEDDREWTFEIAEGED